MTALTADNSRVFVLVTSQQNQGQPIYVLFTYNQVVEVRQPQGICHLPHATPIIPAIFHYRGQVLPVFDVDAAVGGSGEISAPRQLIILRTEIREEMTGENMKIAAITSSALHHLRLNTSPDECKPQSPPRELATSGLLQGYFSVAKGAMYVMLFDLEAIVRGDAFAGKIC
ncbi:MAG: hypothetical protein CSA34_02490 [Desulfobulbus propionicus]|nr:MAG: hypothetical protein CSA34_02490 [Desulfobulbus propionicus]